MPVLKGAMSFQRFRMTASQFSLSEITEKLSLFKFRPLHPRGEDNESFGWVAFQNEYDHEKTIEIGDVHFDNAVVLTLRIDTISLPKLLLKSLVKKSLSAYFRDHQKMADKTVRKEIELSEAQGLRERILPKTRIIEAVWNQTGELRIFSRSQTAVDRFLGVFQDTFLLRPERFDAAAQAYHMAYAQEKIPGLDAITHTPLFTPPIRIDVH